MQHGNGTLIAIGGSEEKDLTTGCEILSIVADHARQRGGNLLIVPAASRYPAERAHVYLELFRALGVRNLDVLDLQVRSDARRPESLEKLRAAGTVFFTGGDQTRILRKMGGTPLHVELMALSARGGVVAGTSAGAAAMPEQMLFASYGRQVPTHGPFMLDAGLGLVRGVLMDTHFWERQRLSRLLGAVLRTPGSVGFGLDEDTALVTSGDGRFDVVGSGGVYVVDGREARIATTAGSSASARDVSVHILRRGDTFVVQRDGRRDVAVRPSAVAAQAA